MTTPDDDKRRSDREPVTLFVEYEGADDLVGDYTENLSRGGTFVATNRELADRHPGHSSCSASPACSSRSRSRAPCAGPAARTPRTRSSAQGEEAGAGIQFTPGPARDQLGVADRTRSATAIPRPCRALFHVLVVEDNRHVATLIQDGLKGSARRDFGGGVSFVVRNAEDGRQADRDPAHARHSTR